MPGTGGGGRREGTVRGSPGAAGGCGVPRLASPAAAPKGRATRGKPAAGAAGGQQAAAVKITPGFSSVSLRRFPSASRRGPCGLRGSRRGLWCRWEARSEGGRRASRRPRLPRGSQRFCGPGQQRVLPGCRGIPTHCS